MEQDQVVAIKNFLIDVFRVDLDSMEPTEDVLGSVSNFVYDLQGGEVRMEFIAPYDYLNVEAVQGDQTTVYRIIFHQISDEDNASISIYHREGDSFEMVYELVGWIDTPQELLDLVSGADSSTGFSAACAAPLDYTH